ncbi:MAG: hypothetical protein H0W67_09345 [Gemmatimonadales bacterium]|nr:hypothetical protein [Gemmatimonadales bacterium]
MRFLAHTLFWIPALRRLADDVADEAEIQADDRAARGQPLVLAIAILALAQRHSTRRVEQVEAPAAGFCHAHLLDRRIRRLAGEPVPARTHLTRRSVVGAFAAISLVWTSGVLMAHPLPFTLASPHHPHCEHRGQSAIRHLFCLGLPFSQRRRRTMAASGETIGRSATCRAIAPTRRSRYYEHPGGASTRRACDGAPAAAPARPVRRTTPPRGPWTTSAEYPVVASLSWSIHSPEHRRRSPHQQ